MKLSTLETIEEILLTEIEIAKENRYSAMNALKHRFGEDFMSNDEIADEVRATSDFGDIEYWGERFSAAKSALKDFKAHDWN